MWFSYNGDGFETHDTAAEAKAVAQGAMDEYRGEACDGWADESLNVCWGPIAEHAETTESRERTEDDYFMSAEIEFFEERELVKCDHGFEIVVGIKAKK